MRDYTTKSPRKVIHIDQKGLKDYLSSIVTDTVEEIFNKILDSEAEEMVGTVRYERNADCRDYRSGSYIRKLQTKAGEVMLNIPKPQEQKFPTVIIEHRQR